MGYTETVVGQIWPMGQSPPNLQLYLKLLSLRPGHRNMLCPSSVIAYNVRMLQTHQYLHFLKYLKKKHT